MYQAGDKNETGDGICTVFCGDRNVDRDVPRKYFLDGSADTCMYSGRVSVIQLLRDQMHFNF